MNTDVTVVSGRVLPPICVLTGMENASVRRDVVLGEAPPSWMIILVFLPMGLWLANFRQMVGSSKRVKLGYYVTPEANEIIMERKKRVKWIGISGVIGLIGGLALLGLSPLSAIILVPAGLILLGFADWYNDHNAEPVRAVRVYATSAVLRGLHPALLTFLHQESSHRSPDGKPMRPDYTPPAPVARPPHSA